MAARLRYYTDEDYEAGVTPSQLKRLSKARQREYMLHWFNQNFEDPVHETPYDSEEGGYLYIWGGPYNALDELYGEFGQLVSEAVIKEVVEEVEEGGRVYWAPTSQHPDRQSDGEWDPEPDSEPDLDTIIRNLEAGAKSHFGDAYEIERRSEVLARLDSLEEALRCLPHGGMGHNRPPPEDAPQVHVVADVRDAGEVIRLELIKPRPDALRVARATSKMKMALNWLAEMGNLFASSFAKAAGTTAGAGVVGIGGASAAGLGWLLSDFVRAATQWLHDVTLPF